jgi:hypothetical protein
VARAAEPCALQAHRQDMHTRHNSTQQSGRVPQHRTGCKYRRRATAAQTLPPWVHPNQQAQHHARACMIHPVQASHSSGAVPHIPCVGLSAAGPWPFRHMPSCSATHCLAGLPLLPTTAAAAAAAAAATADSARWPCGCRGGAAAEGTPACGLLLAAPPVRPNLVGLLVLLPGVLPYAPTATRSLG